MINSASKRKAFFVAAFEGNKPWGVERVLRRVDALVYSVMIGNALISRIITGVVSAEWSISRLDVCVQDDECLQEQGHLKVIRHGIPSNSPYRLL